MTGVVLNKAKIEHVLANGVVNLPDALRGER
jgi:hypothetical protein